MPFSITLPDGYGYCATIALGIIPFVAWMHGNIVGAQRKGAGIPYPNAYATHEQAKSNKLAYKFNCAQRAHANYLENMSQTMIYTLFAGAFYPQATLYASSAWLVFRIIYAYGYVYRDKPNGAGRLIGGPMWIPQGILWGMSIYAAFTQLL